MRRLCRTVWGFSLLAPAEASLEPTITASLKQVPSDSKWLQMNQAFAQLFSGLGSCERPGVPNPAPLSRGCVTTSRGPVTRLARVLLPVPDLPLQVTSKLC